jgi:hypothetical protein
MRTSMTGAEVGSADNARFCACLSPRDRVSWMDSALGESKGVISGHHDVADGLALGSTVAGSGCAAPRWWTGRALDRPRQLRRLCAVRRAPGRSRPALGSAPSAAPLFGASLLAAHPPAVASSVRRSSPGGRTLLPAGSLAL